MRPSKLTVTQASHLKSLKGTAPVPVLAKRFDVSKSTVYRVFSNQYKARKDEAPVVQSNPLQVRNPHTQQPLQLEDFDDLTLATVQFVLAKTQLQKHLVAGTH